VSGFPLWDHWGHFSIHDIIVKYRETTPLHPGVDGLKGFPEAIEAVFPQTRVQLYEQAEANLTAFAAKWDASHPTI
jgi:hypothetical protein